MNKKMNEIVNVGHAPWTPVEPYAEHIKMLHACVEDADRVIALYTSRRNDAIAELTDLNEI